MQNKFSIENQLLLVEQQLDAAMDYLNAGNAQALTQASEALRNTAVDLVQMMNRTRLGATGPEFNAKLGQLAQRLISLRENLLRRSAFVDRALTVVLPTVGETTYQPTRPYGTGPRSSGTMTMVAA